MKALRVGRRGRRVAMVTGIVAAVVMGFALPAWAHLTIASGTTICSNDDHVVTWTIGNRATDLPMTVASATATIGGQSYPVTGYTSPIPSHSDTTATSTVPGDVTGTITLTVHGTWPDGHKGTARTSVDLIENCVPQSTTTVTVEGTTTIFTTTSAGGSATTTPITGLGSTVPTVAGQTVAPGSTALPRTGSSSGYAVFFGLSCIAGGALLAIRRRRNWIK